MCANINLKILQMTMLKNALFPIALAHFNVIEKSNFLMQNDEKMFQKLMINDDIGFLCYLFLLIHTTLLKRLSKYCDSRKNFRFANGLQPNNPCYSHLKPC